MLTVGRSAWDLFGTQRSKLKQQRKKRAVLVVRVSIGAVLCLPGTGGVFCGGVFCGGVFCGGVFVVVFLWWCFCCWCFSGGVFVMFLLSVLLWWCFCCRCFCGGVFVVVWLWFCCDAFLNIVVDIMLLRSGIAGQLSILRVAVNSLFIWWSTNSLLYIRH